MKKILLSALAGAALVAAALPAAAQPFGPMRGASIDDRQAVIAQRIETGVRDHTLTYPEARRLRMESRQIASLEARYRRDGLSRWERNDLQRRLDALSAQVHGERHDGDYRR